MHAERGAPDWAVCNMYHHLQPDTLLLVRTVQVCCISNLGRVATCFLL
jgi:hypothetical protein